MLITLMVIAGVVIMAALAMIIWMYVGNGADNGAAVQRLLVHREQRLAEAHMQHVMQDTVEQMFKAVRDHW